MKQIQKIALFITGALIFGSCSNSDDRSDNLTPSTDVVVQDFVWKGLNSWYYWQKDIPLLADNISKGNDYQKLLSSNTADNLFYNLLYKQGDVDRFSWIVNDVDALLNSFSGISKSSGFDFTAYAKNNTTKDVVALVSYVIPNSPADKAGLKRGDVISAIDGVTMTTDNYQKLYNEQLSLTIVEKASVSDAGIKLEGTTKTVSMSAVVLEENPVAFYKKLEYGGKKIGYLVYNGFQSNYNDELNAAFATMKADGVTELVLDLRYNGGGSVATSVALGQMITGQYTGKPFVSLEFNEKHSRYSSTDNLLDKVAIFDYVNGQNQQTSTQAINSLGLNKVYVLTSRGTASASELLISGLEPYISVVTIGAETYGKFVGYITLFDDKNSDYTSYENRNKTHKWAMQPITFAYFNGRRDPHPVKGIVPQNAINSYEYVGTMKEFGNPSDVALKKALELITGGPIGRMKVSDVTYPDENKFVVPGKTLKPFATEVYIEGFKAK